MAVITPHTCIVSYWLKGFTHTQLLGGTMKFSNVPVYVPQLADYLCLQLYMHTAQFSKLTLTASNQINVGDLYCLPNWF